jgi:hypothetical protein
MINLPITVRHDPILRNGRHVGGVGCDAVRQAEERSGGQRHVGRSEVVAQTRRGEGKERRCGAGWCEGFGPEREVEGREILGNGLKYIIQ